MFPHAVAFRTFQSVRKPKTRRVCREFQKHLEVSRSISEAFQKYFRSISEVFQKYFRSISEVFQKYSGSVPEAQKRSQFQLRHPRFAFINSRSCCNVIIFHRRSSISQGLSLFWAISQFQRRRLKFQDLAYFKMVRRK